MQDPLSLRNHAPNAAGEVDRPPVVGIDERRLDDLIALIDVGHTRQCELDQLRQTRIGVDLLFHARELHQLGGELVGVQRACRILISQLRHQQFEEVAEIRGE